MTDAINWAVALAPALMMAALFAWLDAFKLMSRWEMIGVLLLGVGAGIAAYPLSGRFLDALPLGFSDYSRFAAPWIEEALKAAIVVGLFQFNRIGFKLDAAIQGFAIGAGFALFENILYLIRFGDLATGVWIVRGLGTAIMHGGTGAVIAVFAHELSERAAQQRPAALWRLSPSWFVPGYLLAVAIHLLFNQFPDRPLLAMIAALLCVPATLFAIFHFGAGEARAQLQEDHDAHRRALDALSSGSFPDSESGRRIAAFAAARGEQAAAIREYVEVQTRLVLEAEALLMKQAGSEERIVSEHARADFARADALKRELGRPTIRALSQLLPFTRNDLWEISELRERLRREKKS